jgi:hypothetical protein
VERTSQPSFRAQNSHQAEKMALLRGVLDLQVLCLLLLLTTSLIFETATSFSITPSTSAAAAHSKSIDDAVNVQVWDNVLSPEQCQALNDFSYDHNERADDNDHIFAYPGTTASSSVSSTEAAVASALTPLEYALSSIVEQLLLLHPQTTTTNNTTAPIVVEYWCRQDYLDLEVHSDIDERLLEDASKRQLRYPQFGHVLYLQKDDEEPVGPTCVFAEQLGGWSQNNANDEDSSATVDTTDTTVLVTVPVIPGRLLRFPGSAMHGVPKPLHRWFLTMKEQDELKWSDDDVDEEELERSVVLFNIWEESGPLGVAQIDQSYYDEEGDSAVLPDGIVLDDDDVDDDGDDYDENHAHNHDHDSTLKETLVGGDDALDDEARQRNEWLDEFGDNFETLRCQPKEVWEAVSILEQENGDPNTSCSPTGGDERQDHDLLHVPLMGSKARRLHPKKYGTLRSNQAHVEQGLKDPVTPRMFLLSRNVY